MQDRTDTRIQGYGVLNTDRNELVQKIGSGELSSDESVFQSKQAAKEHLESQQGDTSHLTIVKVSTISDEFLPELIATGEVIEYDHCIDYITAYVRRDSDVYTVKYEVTSYSTAEEYTPFH